MISYYVYAGIRRTPTEIVSFITDLDTDTLFSKTHSPKIVMARNIVYLAHSLKGEKQCDISRKFKVNHATIINSNKRIKEVLQTNKEYRNTVAKVMIQLDIKQEYNSYLQEIKKEFWV